MKLKVNKMFKCTLQELFELPYSKAQFFAQHVLSAEQRLQYAAEIEEKLVTLYDALAPYRDGIPKEGEDWISPSDFLKRLSAIKHWETILEWLYEVDMGWLDEDFLDAEVVADVQ